MTKENDEYDTIKKIAHLPLLVQTTLDVVNGPKLALQEVQSLQKIYELVQQLKSAKLHEVHTDIIQHTSQYLAHILSEKERIDNLREKTRAYINGVQQSLEICCEQAVSIHLDNLQQAVNKWVVKNNLQPLKTRTLIVGTKGPRIQFVDMQFWEKWYEEAGCKHPEDLWLYYIEMLPHNIKGIDIKNDLIEGTLARSELNQSYGLSIRNDIRAMNKDILGQHAQIKLLGLFGKPREIKKTECPIHKLKLKK